LLINYYYYKTSATSSFRIPPQRDRPKTRTLFKYYPKRDNIYWRFEGFVVVKEF
jgi:hypothetical protein